MQFILPAKGQVKRKCRQNGWRLEQLHYDGYYQVKVFYGPSESLIDYLIADDYIGMLQAIDHMQRKKNTYPNTKVIYEPPANTVHSTKQGPN
jgi:hypothetical protein